MNKDLWIYEEKSFILNEREINICREFANQSAGSSLDHYKKRGQSNPEKIKEDIFIGKTGELVVHKLYQEQDFELSLPDFNIYTKKKKSFAADLIGPKRNIHVKTQSMDSINKYGKSWILQKEDKIFKKYDEFDRIVLCMSNGETVTILAILAFSDLIKYKCIEKPKLDWLAKTKVAIYLDTIKKKVPEKNLWDL